MAACIRLRDHGDLDACVRLLEAVRLIDGYPTHWPDDPERWLTPRAMLGAWVAETHGRVVGHVALCAGMADGSAAVCSEVMNVPAEEFAVVTRLFVSAGDRGIGVGRHLLDEACNEATVRDLRPALDVVETSSDAIRLYERCGWRRIFTERWPCARDGKTVLHYYIAPQDPTGRSRR